MIPTKAANTHRSHSASVAKKPACGLRWARLAIAFAHFPVYIDGGFSGDHYTARTNAPIGQTHDGPYIGLGVKL